LLDRFLRSYDLTIDVVPLETLRRLQNYPWPGNIRQLRTAVERFVLLLRAGEAPESINWVEEKAEAQPVLLKTGTLTELREEFDRRVLEAVIERCGGDTAQAARELDISRRSIYNLIHRHGIRLKQKKEP